MTTLTDSTPADEHPAVLTAAPREPESAPALLTDRERQVLHGMAEGRSNGFIGRELFLSEDTIKTHARRLFRKIDARDRAHAVARGFELGILTAPESDPPPAHPPRPAAKSVTIDHTPAGARILACAVFGAVKGSDPVFLDRARVALDRLAGEAGQ